MKVREWPVVGVLLAFLWLFVRGATPETVVGEFLIGLAFGLGVAFAFRRFYGDEMDLTRTARAVPYAALYVGVFLRELLTANVDVARRVLSPSMPIEPDVVVVPLRVQTDLAITTIANSITLTPGTLTMDYDDETNTLYVHGITGKNRQAVLDPIRTWEDYALVIFDEERKPGDPVPEIPLAAEGKRADGGGERADKNGGDVDGTSGTDADGGESDGE